ncbi:MAG: SRPBCC family protein [Actinobacteria bacterium]|nr:SRPBCC family protein [Actinomycetota bacterium]
MPSQAFSHTAVASVGIDQVWSALQDPETWKEIGGVTEVSNPRFDELGLLSYDFGLAIAGKNYRGQARRVEADERLRMVMKIDTNQMDGRIEVDLEPVGEETNVRVGIEIASRGLMAGLMFPVISSAVANGFEAAARQFVRSLES